MKIKLYYLLAICCYKIFKFLANQANIYSNYADYWYEKCQKENNI